MTKGWYKAPHDLLELIDRRQGRAFTKFEAACLILSFYNRTKTLKPHRYYQKVFGWDNFSTVRRLIETLRAQGFLPESALEQKSARKQQQSARKTRQSMAYMATETAPIYPNSGGSKTAQDGLKNDTNKVSEIKGIIQAAGTHLAQEGNTCGTVLNKKKKNKTSYKKAYAKGDGFCLTRNNIRVDYTMLREDELQAHLNTLEDSAQKALLKQLKTLAQGHPYIFLREQLGWLKYISMMWLMRDTEALLPQVPFSLIELCVVEAEAA